MIISIFNQKGGVAKTTTTVNLGAALSQLGKRVLIVDTDPQANATVGLGLDDECLKETIYKLLTLKRVKKERILEVLQKTSYEGLDIMPSDITLSDAEITLSQAMSRETILSRILEQISMDYDFTLIDCPPSLGLLSINSLVASDALIIPVTPSFFSIKGIKHLLNTVNLVQEKLKPELYIMGVLIANYDARKNLSKEIRNNLTEVFGDKVFNTFIRTNSQIEYAQDAQQPIVFFNQKSNGFEDYMSLAREVITHGE
ncbi:AAA family ATPase [Desulfosporosinus sp.]|uniref:ParA family protein n=1 Tax=Desulfosporosinus sp. TaxID=157907 RepID=UPI002311F368|nr:AAA family ATPase [Desulfosporosinus sp.]MDA8222495.1 AAA family ATPase [Desulfitobacterium hafniense]